MDTPLINLPGYRVNEYKIILTPHDDLARKIMAVQKDFIEKYKIEYKSVYLPQLILVTFKQIQAFEERIINRLRIVAMAFHPIKIELKDFGSFPSHTIFINVTSRNEIIELVRKIREDSQRLMKFDADNKPHFITDAHITIARKLKPWQYEKGWVEYSHIHFTGKFIANRMILLRKKEGENKFKPIESFDFQNLPVDIKQGELF
ncbi:2'-5' RNA ligase family protein [Ginsengibacter hankyongi]|uniref:2'-5' RNA ligase family protein n=1 Tax=Ginsengibacter hankyongi TaxID=2607284 RepID=A0A5J5IHA7_9BACT|nr:2'-5' RNA ligase family protein [Ginsengibacter hankyongi]KAA9037122.1 2'-5' RNA ligase family protein [Ginsengibacter hankyongi]